MFNSFFSFKKFKYSSFWVVPFLHMSPQIIQSGNSVSSTMNVAPLKLIQMRVQLWSMTPIHFLQFGLHIFPISLNIICVGPSERVNKIFTGKKNIVLLDIYFMVGHNRQSMNAISNNAEGCIHGVYSINATFGTVGDYVHGGKNPKIEIICYSGLFFHEYNAKKVRWKWYRE